MRECLLDRRPIDEVAHTVAALRQLSSLPLDAKVRMSAARIRAWYEYWDGDVAVAFSGGKDSLVLGHMVREIYPEVPFEFINTGLEYPEIVAFVKSFENVVWLHPSMPFRDVLERYGYPVVSKAVARAIYKIRTTRSDLCRRHYLDGVCGNGKVLKQYALPAKWRFLLNAPFKIGDGCCEALKHRPARAYEKETGRRPYVGTMATDSRNRRGTWLRFGCNGFRMSNPRSAPMSFWTDADVWEYIRSRGLRYCPIYDTGVTNTGCMFCLFGCQYEGRPNRFDRMAVTHPRQHTYCMEVLGIGRVLKWIEDNVGRDTPQPTLFDDDGAAT